jgi:hypothetical protein
MGTKWHGRLAIILLLCIVLLTDVTGCATSPLVAPRDWLERGANTYCGDIQNTDAGSGITTFFSDHSRELAGAYFFTVDHGGVVGQFSQCRVTDARKMSCRWKDQYGTGTLRVEFSSDFGAFEGSWTVEKGDTTYTWNGRLFEANPCAAGPLVFVESDDPADDEASEGE